jgi:hypothetical protein
MKATLTFDLKEDQHTFDCMMSAIDMHSILLEMQEHLRTLEKYQTLTDDQYKLVGELREWLNTEINTQGLSHLL